MLKLQLHCVVAVRWYYNVTVANMCCSLLCSLAGGTRRGLGGQGGRVLWIAPLLPSPLMRGSFQSERLSFICGGPFNLVCRGGGGVALNIYRVGVLLNTSFFYGGGGGRATQPELVFRVISSSGGGLNSRVGLLETTLPKGSRSCFHALFPPETLPYLILLIPSHPANRT